jgi:hypothetical protein
LIFAVPAYAGCGSQDYAYAGLESAGATHGVSAAITALAVPQVARGHVGGWVGVAAGESWIQIGLSAFPQDRTNHVYLEVARPGQPPVYTTVRAALPARQAHRFAVLELAGRPGWWRAWLDDRAVGRPVHLPGSHGRWHAQATAESWNDGTGACNLYAYAFRGVALANAPGGTWRYLTGGSSFADAGYRLTRLTGSSFVARSLRRPIPLAQRLVAGVSNP